MQNSGSQREEAHRWLRHTDPSPIHYQAKKDYEPQTGDWIFEIPEWKEWLACGTRCLWLHGIPGAGKTVLMSHVIDRIGRICSLSSHQGKIHAYYYCYFARQQDESEPFLKWLIHILCSELDVVTPMVYELTRSSTKPSQDGLLPTLAHTLDHLKNVETVYVVIDAVDESNTRENLLGLLQTLATDTRFTKLQILASSREYVDIEHMMQKFSVSISMNNMHLEEDIRCHVRSSLRSNRRFDRWPRELLQETEDSISMGAQGM